MTLFLTLLCAFVATHLVLATPPLRDRLAASLGEKGFRGAYSLLAMALLAGTLWAYRSVPAHYLWVAPTHLWHLAAPVMLGAAILFVGSLSPANKAMSSRVTDSPPEGVFRITRHPMMWSLAIWAAVHATLSGNLPTVLLALGIAVVALVGVALQDRKKEKALGPIWVAYRQQTGWWPLGAQLSGRQPWKTLWPGWVPVSGAIGLWLLATYLHPYLGQPVVPPWGF